MNIGIFLGHPAHFHVLKLTALSLMEHGHNVYFAVKQKDILEDLMQNIGFEYTKIRGGRGNSKLALIKSVLVMEWNMSKFIRKNKIDILVGSTLTFATRILCRKKVFVIGEDDANIVPLYSNLALPFATEILTPTVCDNGRWNKKSIKYQSYQELGYLHPSHFVPNTEIVKKYGIDVDKQYFIIRLSGLNAHHDKGIHGINTEIAQHLIDMLSPHGRIYITSERELEPQFEQYRLHINPLDMHHVIAFASLYIGDSQTMAEEAAVLGIPSLRFNDFNGKKKIGVLEELEHKYHLTYGINSHYPEILYQRVEEFLNMDNAKQIYAERRAQLLADKIDYTKFLTWFIEEYPVSAKIMRENPDYQFRFK